MFVILGFLSLINFALINSHYMLVAYFITLFFFHSVVSNEMKQQPKQGWKG